MRVDRSAGVRDKFRYDPVDPKLSGEFPSFDFGKCANIGSLQTSSGLANLKLKERKLLDQPGRRGRPFFDCW
jgi:hypothetical protein